MSTKIASSNLELRVVRQTIETFRRYPARQVCIFLQRMQSDYDPTIRTSVPLNFLFQQIEEKAGKTFPSRELIDYVDGLRESGFQHVFLFKLDGRHKDYLRTLETPEYIRQQLAKNKIKDCYENPQLILKAQSPQLAVVYKKPAPFETLVFKWIEDRTWYKMVQTRQNRAGIPVYKKLPNRERSANFLRIDLRNGDSELGIQQLNPNPEKSLREEREIYCELIKKMVQFDYFYPVALEPAVRKLIITNKADIESWSITLPGGGHLSGKQDPSLSQKLGLLWRTFTGAKLNAYWPTDHTRAHTFLNGRTDELKMFEYVAPENASGIFQSVRSLSEDSILNPELKHLDESRKARHSIIKKMDLHLSLLEEKSLESRKFSEDEWLPHDEIVNAMRGLNEEYPQNYKIKYQIICPENRQLVYTKKGTPAEFADVKQIPREVACLYHVPKGKVSHPTKGNINAVLVYEAPVELGNGLLHWLEKQLGKTLGETTVRAIVFILFTAIFAGLVWLIVKGFLPFVQEYSDQRIAVMASWFTVLLALIVLIIAVFGSKDVKKAFEFLSKIFPIFLKR